MNSTDIEETKPPRTKSAWESKINWTQIVTVFVMGLAMFGIDVDQAMQAKLAVTISSFASVLTVIWRTWFTSVNIE